MYNSLTPWWQILLAVISGIIFWQAVKRCKQGQFYSDTPLLFWMGIFVWGDALVLAPFWAVTSLLFLFLSPVMVLRSIVLFFIVRATYEVIYWINHQVANREYLPPLFRRFSWIKPMDAAILYQLINMCQVIIGLILLWMTFE